MNTGVSVSSGTEALTSRFIMTNDTLCASIANRDIMEAKRENAFLKLIESPSISIYHYGRRCHN
jgi:hypothetical protein